MPWAGRGDLDADGGCAAGTTSTARRRRGDSADRGHDTGMALMATGQRVPAGSTSPPAGCPERPIGGNGDGGPAGQHADPVPGHALPATVSSSARLAGLARPMTANVNRPAAKTRNADRKSAACSPLAVRVGSAERRLADVHPVRADRAEFSGSNIAPAAAADRPAAAADRPATAQAPPARVWLRSSVFSCCSTDRVPGSPPPRRAR